MFLRPTSPALSDEERQLLFLLLPDRAELRSLRLRGANRGEPVSDDVSSDVASVRRDDEVVSPPARAPLSFTPDAPSYK